MKTNKLFTLGMMAALTLSSCSDDFLEIENPTAFPVDEYYITKPHLDEALVAAYAPLHWFDYGTTYQYNSLHFMGEFMADDMYVNGSSNSDQPTLQAMTNFDCTPLVCPTGLWSDCYSGIKRSNDLLLYLEWAGDNITAEQHADYESQARLLRVFYYNILWKFYGNVPCYFENLEAPYISKQLKADEVYDILIAELEDVLQNGRLYDVWSDEETGKVTRPMAYMLYAEMVMLQNDQARYAKALGYMQDIINSGRFSLLDDYAEIWKESGEWGRESIFEINYFSQNSGRAWDNHLAAGGAVYPRLCGPRDFKPADDCDVEGGWGFGAVPVHSVASFETGDKRRDVTAFDMEANGTVSAGGGGWQYTGYMLGKYIGHKGENAGATGASDMGFNNNYRVYRYAETLLNAAELLLKTGGSAATAATYVNQVRSRAGLSGLATVTEDIVLNERRHELMGEGKRYFDLVRTGKAATVLTPANDSGHYRTKAWSAAYRYLPIPQSEIDAASGSEFPMEQNEGYK